MSQRALPEVMSQRYLKSAIYPSQCNVEKTTEMDCILWPVPAWAPVTILKWKNLSLPLKVDTDKFVICLVLPECLSVKICCISPSNSEANRDGAKPSLLFRCFSLFLPHLRTLAQEKRSYIVFVLGLVESLFLSIIIAKYLNIFRHANNGRSRERKFLAKRFARAIRMH